MPQNAGYYHAAYAVAASIYSLYALSLWRRRRGVRARRAAQATAGNRGGEAQR